MSPQERHDETLRWLAERLWFERWLDAMRRSADNDDTFATAA